MASSVFFLFLFLGSWLVGGGGWLGLSLESVCVMGLDFAGVSCRRWMDGWIMPTTYRPIPLTPTSLPLYPIADLIRPKLFLGTVSGLVPILSDCF